jgi:hypothetical protein
MNLLYIPSTWQLKHSRNVVQCCPAPHTLLLKNSPTNTLLDITSAIRAQAARGIQVHGIITSSLEIVKQYLKRDLSINLQAKDDATLDNYQGVMFSHHTVALDGTAYKIPVVVIQNPEPLQFSAEKRFITSHYISKLYNPDFFTAPRLDYVVSDDPSVLSTWLEVFSSPSCILCAVDIETSLKEIPDDLATNAIINDVPTTGLWFRGAARTKSGTKSAREVYQMPVITCVGYCGIFKNADGSLISKTVVIPFSKETYSYIGQFNRIPAPKVMQNGRYDSSYFLRFNIPLSNWVYDTYMMMHCWYVEIPRSLEAVAAFNIRNHMYWKDESSSSLYEYNAKDCHATAWSCLVMLQNMPAWAHSNYLSIFKQVFPCITCGLEGLRQDQTEARKLGDEYRQKIAADQKWWDTVLVPNFNVNSSPQTKQLFQALLQTGVTTCDKISLTNIVHKHPLWRLMVDRLLTTRQYRKAESTYFNITLFGGRVLYELDPSGTETGRYASKSSNFWCGTQIQNIPGYAKTMFIADDGWELSAIDNAQSESRTTAYIVGDEALIDAVENAPDFHTRNASLFFGIPEDQLFAWKKGTKAEQTLYKKIRNKIGKRVNHGANYNMMETVLINTMTPEVIIEAKHTLNLPANYTFKQVASYLLSCFDKAYPKIRSKEPGGYHYQIMDEVERTQCLTTPDGWVRRTFLQPAKSKMDLNALVAHKPQSWSVRIINRSFFDAWHRYQIVENKCRMKAQIHDEIFYMTKPKDTAYVTEGISKLMARPNAIGDTGKTMIIPNDPKTGAYRWSELKD